MGLPCCHFVGEGPAAELPPALTHYGGPIFPELLEPGTQAVLVGVDPDINGAVAVLSWRNPPASATGSSGTGDTSNSGDTSASASSAEWPAHLATEAVGVEVHDMPIEVWELGTRSKRQPHAAELIALLRQQLGLPGGGGEGGLWGSSGSSNGVGGGGSCKVVTRAVLEHTTPQHLSGKYAWYGMGYSFGLFSGVLTSLGVPHQRVDASLWKRHLGLFRLGKEGSLALARQLFPQAEPLLRRKKDHGRAEAMLLAAWGMGVRVGPAKPTAAGKRGSPARGAKPAGPAVVGEESQGVGSSVASSRGESEAVEPAQPKTRGRKRSSSSSSSSGGGGGSKSSGGSSSTSGALLEDSGGGGAGPEGAEPAPAKARVSTGSAGEGAAAAPKARVGRRRATEAAAAAEQA